MLSALIKKKNRKKKSSSSVQHTWMECSKRFNHMRQGILTQEMSITAQVYKKLSSEFRLKLYRIRKGLKCRNHNIQVQVQEQMKIRVSRVVFSTSTTGQPEPDKWEF